MTEELVEAEVVEEGVEVVPVLPTTLFRTDDPVVVVRRAQETADALKPVIEERKMVQRIGNGQHAKIEGLQTLGAMLGLTAIIEWTNKTDNGWEAKAVVKTLDGRVIGAAESMCDRAEDHWAKADEHAIRSMAQTRAASKALASVLRFVLVLAGYSGTPAEEMPRDGGFRTKGFASAKQRNFMERLLKQRDELSAEDRVLVIEWAQTIPTGQVSKAIDTLKDDGPERLVTAARKLAEKQAAAENVDTADLPPIDHGGDGDDGALI